eukprot:15319-Rhodomonas_salina.1
MSAIKLQRRQRESTRSQRRHVRCDARCVFFLTRRARAPQALKLLAFDEKGQEAIVAVTSPANPPDNAAVCSANSTERSMSGAMCAANSCETVALNASTQRVRCWFERNAAEGR